MADKEKDPSSIEDNLNDQVDDKIHEFWQKNKNSIYASVILALSIVIAFQGLRVYRDYAEDRVQEAYAAALTMEDRRQFIQDNEGHRLAGMAALQVANEDFRGENYESAARYYEVALLALRGTDAGDRARLGKAGAIVFLQSPQEAQSVFEEIAYDERAASDVRAQAFYQIAMIKLSEGVTDGIEEITRRLEELPGGEPWIDRIEAVM